MLAEEVERLRRRARSFLEAAEERLRAGSYDISCFLAEQAVQLYLKSVILEFSGEVPRTHSIRKLLSIMSNLLNVEFDFDRKELVFLEDAYIKARYLSSEYSEEDAKNAIATARRLMSVVDRARKERAEIVRNYKKFLKCIAKVSKELGCEKVFLTGSFAEGKAVLASDIDVLIVFKKKLNAMERAEIIAEIEERCNLPLYHPFELHVVSEREFEFWKRVFKAKLVEIETNLSTEG